MLASWDRVGESWIVYVVVIAYMSNDGEWLMNWHVHICLVIKWWYCWVWTYALSWVICSCITWLMVTDVDIQNVRRGVKSYIRCVCCIEGDDLEVIWYRMHLEESRTLHAFEWLVKHVIIAYVILSIVYWWNLSIDVIGVYVPWWI